MMKMSGTNNSERMSEVDQKVDLATLFGLQQTFQNKVTGIKALPSDNITWFTYHMNAMTEELGEVLKSDKRWKTHRNHAFDPENKLEEVADVFITAMNIAMFSGFSGQELQDKIISKITENTVKFEGEKESIK